MDSNLLKEAIADAKAVRQTALANAKAALEEAFGRRFEAMFAPKLEEDSIDTPPVATAAPAATATAPAMEEDVVNETDIEEIIRELEAEVGAEDQVPAPDPMGAPPMGAPTTPDAGAVPPVAPPMGAAPDAAAVPPVAPAPAPAPVAGVPPEAPAPAPAMEPDGDEMDEEIDINELLESLKEECEDGEEDEDEDGKGKPPWLKESVPAKSSGVGTADNKTSPEFTSSKIGKGGDIEEGVPEGKVTAKEPTEAARPNQAKNATKTNLSTPGGALKENTGGSTPGYPEGAKKTSGGDDATEGVDRPNQADHATKDDLSTVPSPLKEEVSRLRAENQEYKDAVVYLKGQLNEINLLNAKLLYTNKLFKEYSMPNDKKMKVVEMFDLAKNVREVKMTYAVIAESLNFGAEPKKKNSQVQTITEGMASRPVAGTKPQGIITEAAKSDMVTHFQKLAGIKLPSPNNQ